MSRDALLTGRREFLGALALALASRRIPWRDMPGRSALKTLATYQSEGAAYTSALNALAINATSLTAHTALTARVGGDLTKRLSRIVAEAAQDPRVLAGLKPVLASSSAFAAFAKSVSNDARAALNVPGVQAAVSDALAREATLRRSVLAKQSAFAALIRQQAANLKDPARLAELEALEKKVAQQAIAAAVFAVVVAVVLIVIAVVVATFTFGTGAAVAGAAVSAAAVTAGITASAVLTFAQEAEKQAEAARDAFQECLDSAWAHRRSCRNAISTPFPPQREVEEGLCEAKYLAEILLCG